MPRHHQLALFDPGQPSPKLKRHTKAHKKAAQAGEQITLKLLERRFLPMFTVPKHRGECPTERPCPIVNCSWSTIGISSDERAGRPGLSHVPRDESGKTLPMEGDAGDELAEPTLRPIWMEWALSAQARVDWDEQGNVCAVEFVEEDYGDALNPNVGRWEAMEVEPGEPLEVLVDGKPVTTATLTHDGALAFATNPGAASVTLRRPGTPDSCGLDVIERARGPSSTLVVARAMGRSPSWVRKLVRRVGAKLAEQGVTAEDWRALLGESK